LTEFGRCKLLMQLADELELRQEADARLKQQTEEAALRIEESIGRAEQRELAPLAFIPVMDGSDEQLEPPPQQERLEDGHIVPPDHDSLPPELVDGVSEAATKRFKAARLMVLQEEVEQLRAQLAAKTEEAAQAERHAREEQQQRAKQDKAEKQLRAALEREKSVTSELRARGDALEAELSVARRESDEASRAKQAVSSEQRGKDVRLNRALEELDRYRNQLRELREDRDGAGQGARAEAQRLAAECSRLRKRQSELLLAFRKQAKLIDVLKRQKLHAEAACVLGFTEEEFTRTLELGEQAA